MKLTVHIPQTLNDGSPVSAELLSSISERLFQLFGGMTSEGIVNGIWTDAGIVYRDACERLFVVGDNVLLPEAIELIKTIGRELEQKAMYIEVEFYDGPQIITID